MSEIFGGTTTVQDSGYPNSSSTKKNILGKDDFLKMLVTQLHYQDPLNPMKSTEFSAQLAQFSSLEQLQNIDKSLQQSLDANYMLTTSINNTLAANLIGKQVRAYGNRLYLGESKQANVHFDLSADAKNVQIEILDENDQVRRTITLDNLKAGEHSWVWDGKDKSGVTLPTGEYRFRVEATDSEGQAVSVENYISGSISGVRYSNNGAVLMIGNLTVNMSDVYEILDE